MKRPLLNLFALLVVFSLALTACGGGAAPATTVPVATEAPAAATEAPMAEEKTVVIGFTSSLTGSGEVLSKRQSVGLNMWMDDVNNAGGIHLSDGTIIKFASVDYDDESTKERVQELYTRLITEDNADFLISPYSSGLTGAAAIIAEQYGKIMITAGAAEAGTYRLGYTNIYQTYTSSDLYMISPVDMLNEFDSAAKVALVHENDQFGEAVFQATKKYIEENTGLEIVLEEAYPTGTADFVPIINKMVQAGATALIGGGHYNDGTTLVRQIFEQKAGLDLIALTVAPLDTKFAELGDAAVGIMGSSQWEWKATHTEAEAMGLGIEWFGPSGEDFINAYEAISGEKPTYHAAAGYIAGLVLQKAIQDADSVAPEAVKAALDAMNIFTFYGGIQFETSAEEHGLQIGHKMLVAQWLKNDAGELVREVVFPLDVGTADPLFPISTP